MAEIPVVVMTHAAAPIPTPVDATASFASAEPDTLVSDGMTILMVEVASGQSPKTIKAVSQRDCNHGHGAELGVPTGVDRNDPVPAGPSGAAIRPYPIERFTNADGKVEIRCSDPTGVRYWGLRVSGVLPR